MEQQERDRLIEQYRGGYAAIAEALLKAPQSNVLARVFRAVVKGVSRK